MQTLRNDLRNYILLLEAKPFFMVLYEVAASGHVVKAVDLRKLQI